MACSVFLRVTPAAAQAPLPPEASRLRVRIGPLTINPSIALSNFGIDTNVFNQPTDLKPKSDFTFTVTPAADLRLSLFRTVLTSRISEDLVWYKSFATERAANNAINLRWQIPFNRMSFTVNARHANVRDRPGFEIDARSQRVEAAYDGQAEVRIMPKTFVGVTAQHLRTDYDKDAVFLGSNLQFELNRVEKGGGVSLRYKWTPLTSVSLVASRTQTRFEFSPLRDSNATSASAVIAFDPFGILSGGASFGYTSFVPVTPGLPNYKGPIGDVHVSYRLLGTMRIGVEAVRNVAYSYDINQPYYLQTGVSGSVSRSVAGPVDVVARASIQNLAYRDRAGTAVALPSRVDTYRSFGGGVGYRLGRGSRIGFNVDKDNRVSDVSQRQYDNLRAGFSVTYGS